MKVVSQGKKISDDAQFIQEVNRMMELSERPQVKLWERKHAQAGKYFCEGQINKAIAEWEDILVEHPTDMLSLKFIHDMCIVTGYSQQLRDAIARVIFHWKPSIPMYGDLLGMYAFGFEESNQYSEAEKTAKKALEINRHDAWANHCVAHIREMTGQAAAGADFMRETENCWNDSALLCRNYWHWALFHLEMGDFESAAGILDTRILPFMKKGRSGFSVTDAASLCFRLQAEGYNLKARWLDCYDVAQDHFTDYIMSYADLNMMMSCMGAERKDEGDRLMNIVENYISDGLGDIKEIYEDVTLPVMKAIQAYGDEDYATAVELMKPIRYKIHRVGGSHAQRDLFHLFTIHSAMKSKLPHHQKYANMLLLERKTLKGESPMADRLLQQLVNSH